MQIARWLEKVPAAVIDLVGSGDAVFDLFDQYCDRYRTTDDGQTHNQRRVIQSVLGTAVRAGARTAVVERRYTDIDYRDEHSRFYSQTFRQYPATTHRLHFFLEDPPANVHSDDVAAVFDNMTYLGYSVLRPVQGAAVGRTMLAPPSKLQGAVTCRAIDFVNFFGTSYRVEGAPFMAQDNQLGVCAHTCVWMVAYFHKLRYGGQRVLPGDIVDAVPSTLTEGRSLPTPGLWVAQITDALEKIGIPPIVYWMHDTNLGAHDVDRIARQYLDSGLPVIVGTRTHVYTLVGYRADERGLATFVCHDDEVGPYRERPRPRGPLSADADKWRYLIAPVPPQVYITCGGAEQLGKWWLVKQLGDAVQQNPESITSQACNDLLRRSRLPTRRSGAYQFFTSAIPSNEFKRSLTARGYTEKIARAYMRIPMSKWVWVVELADAAAFRRREPSVVAEAIIDSTEHLRDGHVLAWRIPGRIQHWNNDTDEVGIIDLDAPADATTHARAMSVCATSWSRSSLEWG